MQDVMFKCWAKAQIAKQQAKQNIKSFFSEETGAEGLIIAIVLIVIAVAIAVVFRDQISNWVNDLFTAADPMIDDSKTAKVTTI